MAARSPRLARSLWVLLALGAGALTPALADAPLVLQLHCDDGVRDIGSLEAGYLEDGCWGHVGHHTYFAGRDVVYRLHAVQGPAFIVEQQLAPPIEGFGLRPDDLAVLTPVPLEGSLDGRTWELLALGEYRFLALDGIEDRQNVVFDKTFAEPPAFRFLRMREPMSVTQGLSGYVDSSEFQLEVSVDGAAPSPALQPVEGQLRTCLTDILEDIWQAHPCTFGGHHWDTPSFFHTYFLGDSRLDRIQGVAVLAYFRPDDPGGCCGQTPDGILDGALLVQTSVDGEAFTTIGTVPVTYGVPATFDLDGLEAQPAKFVRLVSGHHPGYFNHPALKHAEAYLLHSQLELSGLLPG